MTPEERRKHLQSIASAGGKARAAKLSPERRREIAAMGFAALARKRFGNVRKKAVRALIACGQLEPDRPGDPETLRALHRQLFPERYAEEGPQQARHESDGPTPGGSPQPTEQARHEPDEPEELPF